MSKRQSEKLLIIGLLLFLLSFARPNVSSAYPASSWQDMTRQEISANAKEMVYSKWVSPVTVYGTWGEFYKGEIVTGEAYSKYYPQDDWKEFKYGIDNYSGQNERPGIELGADCSGFVSASWKLPVRQTTSTIEGSGYAEVLPDFSGLKEGDALNDAGSHIILFRKKLDDNRILSYEETPEKAVSRPWYLSTLKNSGYKPLRRKRLKYKNDISAMYDYGGGETRVHGFSSSGSSFNYTGNTGM